MRRRITAKRARAATRSRLNLASWTPRSGAAESENPPRGAKRPPEFCYRTHDPVGRGGYAGIQDMGGRARFWTAAAISRYCEIKRALQQKGDGELE